MNAPGDADRRDDFNTFAAEPVTEYDPEETGIIREYRKLAAVPESVKVPLFAPIASACMYLRVAAVPVTVYSPGNAVNTRLYRKVAAVPDRVKDPGAAVNTRL